jgi:hypothetical protein
VWRSDVGGPVGAIVAIADVVHDDQDDVRLIACEWRLGGGIHGNERQDEEQRKAKHQTSGYDTPRKHLDAPPNRGDYTVESGIGARRSILMGMPNRGRSVMSAHGSTLVPGTR